MISNQRVAKEVGTARTDRHYRRKVCRVCGSRRLHKFLSLGPTPLANSFLRSHNEISEERFYPLNAYFCETCALVQLLDVIDPEVLFRNYIYLTGISETIAEHNAEYVRTIDSLVKLRATDLVVEVASNDGSLLKCFNQYGVRTLGIEPAVNIAQIAEANGIRTIPRFFNSRTALEVRDYYGPIKVVIANNVLAHVDEPLDFLIGCRELIEEDGLVSVEVPSLRNLIEGLEYDTIYHEHLCYFSINALCRLFNDVGLAIFRIDHIPVHGGSLRIYAGLKQRYREHSSEVALKAKEERCFGLTEFECFERFATEVEENRRKIVGLFETLKKQGRTIAGYGAPAKGNTFLNYCRIDNQLIPFVVDKNPLKVGLLTPGTHIPVLPVSTLLERQPDYVLILAWNFANEIMSQQKEYLKRGGQFIIPIPEAKVV